MMSPLSLKHMVQVLKHAHMSNFMSWSQFKLFIKTSNKEQNTEVAAVVVGYLICIE